MMWWRFQTSKDRSFIASRRWECPRPYLQPKRSRGALHTNVTYSTLLILPRINSRVHVNAMTEALAPSNAISLLSPFDVILDCSDNAPTRYLLSDTAVFLGKPLVSGAAQKYDGQLCTYNLGNEGPCYRCLFAKPPAVETVGTCEETGILGVVTGIIGNLQALETIRIITGLHGTRLVPKQLDLRAHTLQIRNRHYFCIPL